MGRDDDRLPAWVIWQRRPFPDANLLLLRGARPHAAAVGPLWGEVAEPPPDLGSSHTH